MISCGLDLVEIPRIEALYRKYGSKFIDKILSENEKELFVKSKKPFEFLAGRWAAKEAVYKCLNLRGSVLWSDISIERKNNGAPMLRLVGRASHASYQAGISSIHLSLSHTTSFAAAQAIAE